MEAPRGLLFYLLKLLAFLPFFAFLFVLGLIKAFIFGPVAFLIVLIGNSAIIVGLWPCHVLWTYYCILKTKKFGLVLKALMVLCFVIPLLLWPLLGVIGSLLTGVGYGLFSPLMATFEAVAGGSSSKFVRCFTDGTWSSVLGACTIVRDFFDICFHTFFSVTNGLLESKTETAIEIRLLQLPGCLLAGILGVLIDVPIITLIVIYKAPILLFKGWQRLLQDLIGRNGPFMETVCIPFAGLSILLWPLVVGFATVGGIISSFFVGCYAAIVVHQESSTRQGLLYIVSAISLFDEYTNDSLGMREGSWFPRPRYRKNVAPSLAQIPLKQLSGKDELVHLKHPPIKTPSMKMQELKAMVIWDNLFKACGYIGKELIGVGAISSTDLEAWQDSNNMILNVGLPAYVFLQCFLRSIKSGSSGFLMRDNTELTSVNRPEGRVFDWFFEPMTIMKEQIKAANIQPIEEAFLNKLTLYGSNNERIEAWQNGGLPPADEVRKALLVGISRRLQGFGLTISRMPTFRRRFHEVVKALFREARQRPEEESYSRMVEIV